MTHLHRSRLLIASAALAGAALADQATKWLILTVVMQPPQVIPVTPFLNLTLGFNTGVSFGLFRDVFEDIPWLLAGAKLLIVAALLAWAAFASQRSETVGLGLIAGGALGNVIDRARQGAVRDFLDLHAAGWHWPTFNVADVAITLGAALLIFASVFPRKAQGEALPEPSR